MITHRCAESLSHECSIRYQKKFDYMEKPKWFLYVQDYGETLEPYMYLATDIKYCPFCGEKLKEYENG